MASKARAQANLLGSDGKIKATQFGNDTLTSDMLAPNLELTGDYVKVPVGTTAERPGSPEVGHLRFNTSFGKLEQYVTDGWQAVDTPPTVTSLTYSGGVLAADLAGGETVTITGSNFQSGATVTFGDTSAASVTVSSSTSITATTPAKTAGDYDVKVTNPNGLSATLASEPDSGTLSYSITSGAVPSGLTFDSDGTIVGTTPDGGAADTTYNFTVTATDDENQTNSRAFNLVVLRNIYGYSISRSLMFNDDDSQYLSRTYSTSQTNTKGTWSFWYKVADISQGQMLWQARDAVNNTLRTYIYYFNSQILVKCYDSGASEVLGLTTTQVFRDPSAWYHIVVNIDTTQATSSERAKLYINGERVTAFSTETYPSQNFAFRSVSSVYTEIGKNGGADSEYADGYLTEYHFIDGTALTPTSFGESYTGLWVPKDYTGSYGTNGFHLESPAYLETHSMSHMSFDGSNDVMTTSSNNDFNLSSRTFTIEGWVRNDVNANNKAELISVGSGGSSVYWNLVVGTANNGIGLGYGGGTWAFSGNYTLNGITPPANEWYYFALVGTGSTLRYYVNGAFVGALAFNAFGTQGGTFHFGNYYNNYNSDGSWFQGDIGDFRITKDSALYTDDFHTVPTSSLTAVSGTVLLFNGTTTDETGRHSFSVSGVSSESADTYNYYDGKIEDLSGNSNHWTSVAGYKPTLDTPTE